MNINEIDGGFSMPTINVPAMEISNEAMLGLLSGELIRRGGVIYKKSGGIFAFYSCFCLFLPEISINITYFVA